MILNLILLVLLGAVAFFQYLQGLFSATISVIIAVIAATMAISYHESLASVLVSVNFPAQASPIALVVIFAAVYLLLRMAFDAMVPGNVRFPWLMDKIGAGVMGVIVGLIGTGIVAITAQMIPFPSVIAGYSRYPLYVDQDHSIPDGELQGQYMPRGRNYQDVTSYDVLKNNTLEPTDPDDVNHLWFHQDDLVMWLTSRVSNGGSMEGDQPLAAIHPDYLAELYGQRLGIQLGTKHVLVSTDGNQTVKASGVYTADKFPQVDGEIAGIRKSATPLPNDLIPENGKKLLIVRVTFSDPKIIADSIDAILRFSPASIRLVTAEQSSGDAPVLYKDYNPIATLDPRGVAVAHRIDDFMAALIKGTRTIDFIFELDNEAFNSSKTSPDKLHDGTFLEVKRYGRVDLSDQTVKTELPPNKDLDALMYKPQIDDAIIARASGKTPATPDQQPQPGPTPPPTPTTPTPTPTPTTNPPPKAPDPNDPLGLHRKFHSIGLGF